MKTTSLNHSLIGLLASLCLTASVWAGPGAHGPDGEHLHEPAATQGAEAVAAPRLVLTSDRFELLATLQGGELSVLLDRYDTNEPVLEANVQLESGGLKADARFHADHGDFAIDDPALLAALSRPGQHALTFTVTTEDASEHLQGLLLVSDKADPADEHEHGLAGSHVHGTGQLSTALAIVAGLTVASIASWWLARRASRKARAPSTRND